MRNVAAAGGTRRTHRVALLANDRRLRLLLLGVVLLGATHILSTHRFVPDLHSDADPRADQLLIGGKGWPAGVWWEHSALKQYQGCVATAHRSSMAVKGPRGYLRLMARGGINQQRQQICDTVALAQYLGARLVVPELSWSDAWRDNTTFKKVFDLPFFVETLRKDVVVVEEHKLEKISQGGLAEVSPPNHGRLQWYDENVRPLLRDDYVVVLSSMVDRLQYDHVPSDVQQLRCRACFHALQWAPSIVKMGAQLVDRMHDEADVHTNSNRFVGVHLRTEQDEAQHSGCASPANDSRAAHTADWALRVGLTKASPQEQAHAAGHCPLSLSELTIFLQGLGYARDTPLYLAGGDEFEQLDGYHKLKHAYPNIYTKSRLLDTKDLKRFAKSATTLAALDYIVCLHSTVFVSTHGSNMADFLMGERTYFRRGLSIAPHKRELVRARADFLADGNAARLVRSIRQRHKDVHALPLRQDNRSRAEASVYRHPLPDCMCKSGKKKPSTQSPPR